MTDSRFGSWRLMMRAVERARRGLIAAGFGADLSAEVSPPGAAKTSTVEDELSRLAEIAAYIRDYEPNMIGAAWLLERSGFQRTQLRLFAAELNALEKR
jgi:hypothetical protein